MKRVTIEEANDHAELEREFPSIDEAVAAVRAAWAPLDVTADTAAKPTDSVITDDDWTETAIPGERELVLVRWAPDGRNNYEVAVILEEEVED